jgi:Tol biopolymer transport system component
VTRYHLFVLALLLALPSALLAQYPPHYRWHTVETENFLVHYHEEIAELAPRAAAIAEAAHRRIVPIFEWTPSGKTHLVLTDHIDASNGSATPFPSNRMEVWVSAPGADPSSPLEHYDNWLNLVITHEYAHIVHLDMARGLSGRVRKIFGRTPASFPNMFSPLWMLEGIATLVESDVTEAGRLKGTFVDMVLRTAAVEGRFPTEPQASGLTGAWPEGGARYYYGSAFLSWLATTEGAERLARYFHDFAGNIIPYRVNASARSVYGRNMTELWRQWSAQAQAEYRAERDAIAAAGLSDRETLTDLGYETKYPLLSPDARLLAYASRDAYGWPRILVRDLASGRDIERLRVNSISPLSWSPDGNAIAFSQLEFSRTYSLLSDLYIWDRSRGDVRRVTRGARLKGPSFTPDGRSLIAVENRGGRNRIVSVDAATGAVRPLIQPDDFRQFSEPNVSPAGDAIAVAEWLNGRIDVVLYDMSGVRITNLSAGLPSAANASPRFSRDGSTVWFTSDATGVANIYSVPVTGGIPQRRTNVYGGAFFPTTTDGTTIYYSDYSAAGFDIARTNGTGVWPVTPREVPRTVTGVERSPEQLAVPEPAALAGHSPYSPARSVLPRWWLPILEAVSTSNEDQVDILVGALTLGSDALGFHQYEAQVAARIREEYDTQLDYTLIYSYTRLYPTITIAGLQFTDPTGVSVVREGVEERYEQRVQRMLAQATFPFSRYRWQSALTLGGVAERTEPDAQFEVTPETLASVGLHEGTLYGPRLAAYFNTARQFSRSISPENGVTGFLDAETLTGDRSFRQLRTDLRGFLSLPVARSPLGRHVAAARVAAGWTGGDFLLERELKVGGVGSEGLLSTGSTHFPVRGFSTGTLRGRNAALVSLEYRFPLYEIDRGPSVWPIFFHRIFADVFYDTATAWYPYTIRLPQLTRAANSPFDRDNTISSAGAEVAMDVYLGFFVPLRLRAGGAYLVSTPRCPARGCGGQGDVEFYWAIGRSF